MYLEFTKMHGLGNDFMVVDLITQRAYLDAVTIQRLADRHFGVGFDQLLIVEPELGANGWVRVNMGPPKFLPEEIPFITQEHEDAEGLYQLELADNKSIKIDVVNMGNPHAVTIVPDVLTADVERIGPQVESHARFPARVNAGFMQIIDEKHIRLRVYERGVGETLACGTGACAAAVSGMRRGLLANEVEVQLAGGKLHIAWREGDVVWMTGPTTHVYDARLDLRYFQG